MKKEDAEGLFQCYSNRNAARYFNGDCCNDDFYYADFNRFVRCMEFLNSRNKAEDFGVCSVIIKAPDYAEVRRKLLEKFQFVPAKEKCNISFADYVIRF